MMAVIPIEIEEIEDIESTSDTGEETNRRDTGKQRSGERERGRENCVGWVSWVMIDFGDGRWMTECCE